MRVHLAKPWPGSAIDSQPADELPLEAMIRDFLFDLQFLANPTAQGIRG